jgi:hypothetical protein
MKRRRWLKWVSSTVLAVLVLGGLGAGALYYPCCRSQQALRDAEAELDGTDPGWRLADIQSARAPIDDAHNGALVVLKASSLLPKSWPSNSLVELLEDVKPNAPLPAEVAAKLRKELASTAAALEVARTLDRFDTGRYPISYKHNFVSTDLSPLENARMVVFLLHHDVRLLAHEGKLAGAARSCRAIFNVARSIGDEPLSLAQINRANFFATGCRDVEMLLGQGELSRQDLDAFRRLVDQEEKLPALEIALRGERACIHELLLAMENGEEPMADSSGQTTWREKYLGFIARSDLRADHAKVLPLTAEPVRIARLPPHQWQGFQAFSDRFTDLKLSPHLGIVQTLAYSSDNFRLSQAALRCLSVALAAERHRLDHGDWPDAPVNLPLDPFDGQPLRYRKLADGLMVYSVGFDEADDQGNLRKDPHEVGSDFGFRLWNPSHRVIWRK